MLLERVELFYVAVLREPDGPLLPLLRQYGRGKRNRQCKAKPRDERGARIEATESLKPNHRCHVTPAGVYGKIIVGQTYSWRLRLNRGATRAAGRIYAR